jgi:hypothetical protein
MPQHSDNRRFPKGLPFLLNFCGDQNRYYRRSTSMGGDRAAIVRLETFALRGGTEP